MSNCRVCLKPSAIPTAAVLCDACRKFLSRNRHLLETIPCVSGSNCCDTTWTAGSDQEDSMLSAAKTPRKTVCRRCRLGKAVEVVSTAEPRKRSSSSASSSCEAVSQNLQAYKTTIEAIEAFCLLQQQVCMEPLKREVADLNSQVGNEEILALVRSDCQRSESLFCQYIQQLTGLGNCESAQPIVRSLLELCYAGLKAVCVTSFFKKRCFFLPVDCDPSIWQSEGTTEMLASLKILDDCVKVIEGAISSFGISRCELAVLMALHVFESISKCGTGSNDNPVVTESAAALRMFLNSRENVTNKVNELLAMLALMESTWQSVKAKFLQTHSMTD